MTISPGLYVWWYNFKIIFVILMEHFSWFIIWNLFHFYFSSLNNDTFLYIQSWGNGEGIHSLCSAQLKTVWYILVDEWRQRYHLSGQLLDSSPDDLIRDMGDIQPHVRLQAIATLAKVAEYKAMTDDPFGMAFKEVSLNNPYHTIPEKLFVALECLLEDSNDRVRCAAAISLYSLNRPCDQVMLRQWYLLIYFFYLSCLLKYILYFHLILLTSKPHRWCRG